MRGARSLPLVAATLALIAATVSLPRPLVFAQTRATLMLVSGRIPRDLPNAEAVLRYARGHRARRLTESHEPVQTDRTWEGTIVMQFRGGVGDRNVTMLLHDVTDGERAMVGSPYDLYASSRDITVLSQDFRIQRRFIRPNRTIEASIRIRSEVVGTIRFTIAGEPVRGNGAVDFTGEDRDHAAEP